MDPEEPNSSVITIPYRRLDGSASWFDPFEPTVIAFPSTIDPDHRELLRTIDGIERDLIWVEYKGYGAQIPRDQRECTLIKPDPSSSFGRLAQSIGLSLDDVSIELRPAGPLLEQFEHNEVTIDQAALWCRNHLVCLPEILLQDLAQRSEARIDVGKRHGVADKSAIVSGTATIVVDSELSGRRKPRKRFTKPRQEDIAAHRAGARGDGTKTERRVAETLRESPNMTSNEVSEATGISPQRVRTTNAWKENRKRLDRKREQASVRTVPLTDAMLSVRSSNAEDPAEIAAERDELERERYASSRSSEAIESLDIVRAKYIEGADANQRARFHKMTKADQEHELTSWRLTGDRLD